MKLSLKINLLFTIIVTSILGGMTLLIFNLSRQNVHQDFHERLRTRAARTAYLYSIFKSDTTNLLKSLDANTPPALFNKNIIIYDTAYHVLYEFDDANAPVLKTDTAWLRTARIKGEIFTTAGEKFVYVLSDNRKQIPIIVVVAAENIAGKEYIGNLKNIFLIYFPIAVLITLIAGYLFSRTIIKPVRETIRDVQLITSQNLSHRLYVGNRKDELAELNATFNDLLNRLEESFAIEKRFISNASHELSTPLTSISSQIQVALLQDRDIETYKRILDSILKDVQGLHYLTRNLLEIARAGTNGAIALEAIRLDEILVKAHSDILRQYPNFSIGLLLPELPDDERECQVFGNAHLLNSAFKNIMENGCKYSPDHTTQVEIIFGSQQAEIFMINKSEFLSEQEIERLFEPFYRSTNATDKPGMGLGLALTRRIISLHKGILHISFDPDKGTVIHIVLPTLKK